MANLLAVKITALGDQIMLLHETARGYVLSIKRADSASNYDAQEMVIGADYETARQTVDHLVKHGVTTK